MKKPVTFRFDNDLLERARRRASAENRSLTNFVETALLRVLGQSRDGPIPSARPSARAKRNKEDND
jgi:hypothetical protein